MRKRVLSIMIMGLILVPFLFSAVAAKTLKIGSMSAARNHEYTRWFGSST